jgi:hypothetical protein
MRWFVLVALLPACSLYFGNDPATTQDAGSGSTQPPQMSGNYELVKTRSIGGEHTIAGVDSDGAGGIWIAYCDDADYYTPKNVWVTHLDKTGAKLSEWMMNDHYEPVRGIAFAGDVVWLNYSVSGTGNRWLRELDAHTGATLGTIATEDGIVDIAYDAANDQLLLSDLWNQVIALDPTTGGEQWRTPIAAITNSTQRGIAYNGSKIWLDELFDNKFFLVDTSGTVVATADTSVLGQQSYLDQRELAWDGSQLLVVFDNQIYWFALRPA